MESGPNDYSRTFDAIKRERPDALYLGPGPYLLADRHRIIAFATQHRVPTMGQGSTFADTGALITYASNLTEFWDRTTSYVDRILRGAKPPTCPSSSPPSSFC